MGMGWTALVTAAGATQADIHLHIRAHARDPSRSLSLFSPTCHTTHVQPTSRKALHTNCSNNLPTTLQPQADWLKFGFILSVFYLSVWMGVGGAWWKVIGLW